MNIIKKLISILLILIVFFIFHNLKYSDNNKYDLVIPIHIKDINKTFHNQKLLKKFIEFNNIIIIGSEIVKKFCKEKKRIIYIHEDTLIPKKEINELFIKRGIENQHRVGWYFQQFLKMAYSRICKNEYYIIWDADTIPIKKVHMFEKNHPIFDMKTEHHIPYFITMSRLIPDLKFVNRSYISEHMIIKTEYMKNLLNEIESKSNITGKKFWEKIIMSIDKKDITKSGFSEYETYGSYVDTKYPTLYNHREWHSLRKPEIYFGNIDKLNQKDIILFSKKYDAITIEAKHKIKK